MKVTRLGITGSRSITNPRVIAYVMGQTLEEFSTIDELHHGNAIGVDRLAAVWAADRGGIKLVPHHATAGHYLERDRKVVDTVDLVVAIWDGSSKGTKYTMDYARRKGKLHAVWNLSEVEEELGTHIPM